MSEQKSKLDLNKDYKKLAQICTIMQSKSLDARNDFDRYLKKILATFTIMQQNVDNINIDYQISSDSEYYKINNPKLFGYTALHFAVEQREYKIVQMLLKFGADFTIKNNNNESVLHLASQYIFENLDSSWGKIGEHFGQEQLKYPFVNLLLSTHISFSNARNPSNNCGISHFHIACLVNDIKAIQFFLENGVSVNQAVNSDSLVVPGYTPLHFAIRFFNIETLEILIEKGADISLKDAKKMSPLHLLIERNIAIINYISIKEDFKENFESNKKMIKLLMGKNLSTDFQLDDMGFSSFHAACTLQDVALVKQLIEKVSDLNHSINNGSSFWAGYTALHFAAHFDVETVQFLIKEGADILIKDCQGMTPLDILLQKYNVQDLESIINSQPQWKNILFSDNKTKLIDLISSMQTKDEFESFLSKVPDVNMFVPFSSSLWPGYTPLHLAVAFCNSKNDFTFYDDINRIQCSDYETDDENQNSMNKIQVCLKLGADITAQDVYGSTAVHVAFHKKRMDIVDHLLKKQSKICQPVDHKGLSHLHMAFVITQKNRYINESLENADSEYVRSIAILANQADKSITLKSKLITIYNYKDRFDSYSEYPKIIYANVGSTPLHIAVQAGNTILTEKLLACGFDINSKDINGFTPIHQLIATRMSLEYILDSQALCELLFSSNLSDCVSNCGLNYLHVACYLKNEAAVKKLLESGADVNATITPFLAMDDNDFPELQLLLKHQHVKNCATDSRDTYRSITSLASIGHYANYTPLHFAVSEFEDNVNYKIVDMLLRRGANMLAKKVDGSVILYEILAENPFEKYSKLKKIFYKELKRNVQWQNLVEEDSGITMLHLACKVFDLKAVERMLKSGDNANARCFSNSPLWPGCTPLHILLMSKKETLRFLYEDLTDKIYAIAKMLLRHGAEITIHNANRKTPLHESIKNTNHPCDDHELSLTKMLLKYHKDFSNNPIDDRGISHFHIACMCNDLTIVSSFLQHGVDVNQATDFNVDNYGGYTPLHFAVLYQFEEILLLLQHNADVNATNCLMETPLHLARLPCGTRQSETEHLEILLNAGAKVNEKNIYGETPLEKLLERMKRDNYYEESSHVIKEETVNTIIKHKFGLNVFPSENEYTEKGFIGSILCNKKSYGNVLQNPVFQAVLKAPDLNGPDFLGRSVIHNVVSTGWNRDEPSTAEYITIIEELTRLGFDIDHRDKRGFTPLHVATMNENSSAIESLLIHGANVNSIDARGDNAHAYCVDDNEDGEVYVDWTIHRIFNRHFNKLSRFNLYVHPANKKSITEMPTDYSFNQDANERHEARVTDEDNRLKSMKIEPYSISLHDFLCETGVVAGFPFMLKPKQKAISKFFREKGEYLRKNFPELTGILYFQYKKALERELLIHPATISLNVLLDFELPILCSENIFKFLSNIELKKLIATKKLCNL